jgi:general secretion pathway protein H
MAPTRRSATGDQAGFTLTELLVVLAIVGLLIAAIPVLLRTAMPGMKSLAAARALAQDLRMARGQAIASGAATTIRFDTNRQVYLVEPGDHARKLPDAVRFSISGQRPVTQIGFYADGSSTGGVVLVGDGALRHRVTIAWLTGRVAIDE